MEHRVAEHITTIIDFLNCRADYAVLRNYDGLPNINNSRDIDIIITKKSFKTIRKELVGLIEKSGWKIVVYLHSDRLITLVCGVNDEKGTEMVQWDFFMDTSVFGIVLMNAEEFLIHKKFNGFLYHTDKVCEFLDKYLYNRAVGKPYPVKYESLRQQVEGSDIVRKKLMSVFGTESVSSCDKSPGKKLLLYALSNSIRRAPIATFGHMSFFLYTFIRNYIHSDTGFSIGFSGPDGVGKTTVITTMLNRLAPVFGTAHCYYHFRPMIFGNLGDVANSYGIKKNVDREYDRPHRGKKTGLVSSLLRLVYYSTDYIVGYFVRVKTITRITRIAIFDRYYTDIICDSRRSRIYLSPIFLYWWGHLFIPKLDYNILLTAGVESVLSRKCELTETDIKAINDKIDYLARKKGFKKVLNDSAPDNAVNEIITYIFKSKHNENMKRL